MIYQGRANLVRWLDGDTCEVTIRVPVDACKMVVESTRHLRLVGIGCPEKKTAEGKEALNFVNAICPPGPYEVSIKGFEKYGRWLGSVANFNGHDVAGRLLEEGHATPLAYGYEEAHDD